MVTTFNTKDLSEFGEYLLDWQKKGMLEKLEDGSLNIATAISSWKLGKDLKRRQIKSLDTLSSLVDFLITESTGTPSRHPSDFNLRVHGISVGMTGDDKQVYFDIYKDGGENVKRFMLLGNSLFTELEKTSSATISSQATFVLTNKDRGCSFTVKGEEAYSAYSDYLDCMNKGISFEFCGLQINKDDYSPSFYYLNPNN